MIHIWIEEHEMTVIEVDGVYVQPYITSGISLATGQRLSVLVIMDQNPTQNYPLVAAMGNPPPQMEVLRVRSKHVRLISEII